MFLISDTNASIKFAAFGKLFFENSSIIGELGTCGTRGHKELKELSKQNITGEMKKCVDCALSSIGFYTFDEFSEYEFWDYDARYYKDAEEKALESYGLGGACENDKYFLHLAVTYGNILVTNDLPLYYLAVELINIGECEYEDGFSILTVEDLVIKAFDNGDINKAKVKEVIKVWNKAKRSVLKIKRPLFEERGLM